MALRKSILVALCIAIPAPLSPVQSAIPAPITAKVTAVHDGDTLTLEGGTKIRLFGIDAPELRQQCRTDKSCVPCGEQSRKALADFVLGKQVSCYPSGRSYDRVVAMCILDPVLSREDSGPISRVISVPIQEGQNIGLWMVRHGQAIVYRQYLKGREKTFMLKEEATAKAAKEGIWSTTFIPPADWRSHKQRLECER